MKVENGFTLMETLIVLSIFTVIGSMALTILTIALREANKTKVINDVRKNGNYALNIMSRMIRNSKSTTIYNGSSFVDCTTQITGSQLKILSLEGQETTLQCLSDLTNITANSSNLMNSSLVKLERCSFSCNRTSSNTNPYVTIDFSLKQANADASYERATSIPFKTTILIRNK